METKRITVETTINATQEKVWKYWTKPKHITKRNFASDDLALPKIRKRIKDWRKNEFKDGSKRWKFWI